MWLIRRDFPAHFPQRCERPVPAWAILNPGQARMQLEFHQLDRRWEQLRGREPHRQRRMLASLADCGEQTPVVVVVCQENRGPCLGIDGLQRVATLEQPGRDTAADT